MLLFLKHMHRTEMICFHDKKKPIEIEENNNYKGEQVVLEQNGQKEKEKEKRSKSIGNGD